MDGPEQLLNPAVTKIGTRRKSWMKMECGTTSKQANQAGSLHVGETRRGQRIQEKKVVGHLTWGVSNIAQGQVYEFRKESQ